MMNTKKSRRGMVALSVLAALIICSFATIYAFAANAATPTNLQAPENPVSSLPEAANVIIADTEKDITSEIKFGGVLAVGYKNSDGETVIRISNDGGITWYGSDDINYKPDPNISTIEWITYDECRAWLDNKKSELSDEDIEWYESAIEDMKNGIGEAGKVTIENREIAFIFHTSETETSSDKATITIDGVDIYTQIDNGIQTIRAMESYVYAYIQPEDGEKMGFGGDTFAHLKRLVKNYFNERVEAGKMTQTEADGLLAGLTQDSTRLAFDSEGNRVK